MESYFATITVKKGLLLLGIQTNDFSLCQIFLKSVIIMSILPGIFKTLLSLPSFGVS